ncbi:MAG TPA: rod shape-determining protein [Candidatus Binatia bacterium]
MISPYVALDLGCHTARACALSDERVVACRVHRPGDERCPLLAGVVVDVPAAGELVADVLHRVRRFTLGGWRAVVCAPSDASDAERCALLAALERAGAHPVAVLPEPLAAAVGAGLEPERWAQLVVDVGHGVTDVGVLRSAELIASYAMRFACGAVQDAVRDAVADRVGLRIHAADAEALCKRLAELRAAGNRPVRVTQGRDETVAAGTIVAAADEAIETIARFVGRSVRDLPHEVACEVIESGITLTGGGACLDGLGERVAAATGIAVRVVPQPQSAVIFGARTLARGLREVGWSEL